MDELFDVFDDQTPGEYPSSKQKPKKDKSKKRLASGEAKDTNGTTNGNGDVSILEAPQTEHPAANGDSQPDAKRQRREVEAEPLVTDTFETEQSREVAASAGLRTTTTCPYPSTKPQRSPHEHGHLHSIRFNKFQ